MRRTAEKEILKARADLGPLIEDTRFAIGEVACAAYRGLKNEPGTASLGAFHSLTQRMGVTKLTSVNRRRNILLPTNPPSLSYKELQVASVATETTGNELYVGGIIKIPLPRTKIVVVSFETQADKSRSVAITDSGEAFFNDTSDRTQPYATDKEQIIDPVWGYRNPDSLKRNYSWANQGALGVTRVVASNIERIFGAQIKMGEINRLEEYWQQVYPREMSADIAYLLPQP